MDETIQAVTRYMNAQSHYQILQQRHMDQVIDLAQTFQRGLSLRDTQIQGLNGLLLGEITPLHSLSFRFWSMVLR